MRKRLFDKREEWSGGIGESLQWKHRVLKNALSMLSVVVLVSRKFCHDSTMSSSSYILPSPLSLVTLLIPRSTALTLYLQVLEVSALASAQASTSSSCFSG